MKYKDPVSGEIKSISVKASDTLPIGSVVDFEGTEIPEGWEQVIDNVNYFVETDLDTVVGEVIVGYCHRCTNRPGQAGENGNIIYLPHSGYPSTYGQQIYISRPSGYIYTRTMENGVWGKWYMQSNHYTSTEEVIGTFMGKPLYRRVGSITFTSVYESGGYTKGTYLGSDLENITITKIFSSKIGHFGVYNSYNKTTTSNIYVENVESSGYKGYIMGFTANEGFLNTPFYVVVEYTKTTD